MCPARRPWHSIGLLVLVVLIAAAFGATSALLAWAGCMRENGVEMDDPQFGLDGELVGGLGKDGTGQKADAKSELYQLAGEACSDQLAAFKAPPDPEQLAEQTEQLLAWSACMREQGIDMPDPNADGSYADYDWKLDLKGDEYVAADEVCREASGNPLGK